MTQKLVMIIITMIITYPSKSHSYNDFQVSQLQREFNDSLNQYEIHLAYSQHQTIPNLTQGNITLFTQSTSSHISYNSLDSIYNNLFISISPKQRINPYIDIDYTLAYSLEQFYPKSSTHSVLFSSKPTFSANQTLKTWFEISLAANTKQKEFMAPLWNVGFQWKQPQLFTVQLEIIKRPNEYIQLLFKNKFDLTPDTHLSIGIYENPFSWFASLNFNFKIFDISYKYSQNKNIGSWNSYGFIYNQPHK